MISAQTLAELPAPSWATSRKVEVGSDGSAVVYFTASFGAALLTLPAEREHSGAPWVFDAAPELCLRIEASTSADALRDLAADLRRAADALGGPVERPLRRLPGAIDELMGLDG